MSDGQLAALSRRGDGEAFSVLVRRWNRPLRRFAARLLGDDEEARDVCQEALVKAWTSIGGLREPELFKPWLHRIAVNLCRDRGRARGTGSWVPLTEAEEPQAPVNPHDDVERRDATVQLRRLLARLPIEQRTAIVLAQLEGFTSVEIASITGANAATVRSRIFYGLKALRRMLPEDGRPAARAGDGP